MATSGSIGQELFQPFLVDYTTGTVPAGATHLVPTPGYSTEIEFVRTPTSVIIHVPALRGVIAGGAAGPLQYDGVVPANYQIATYVDQPILIYIAGTASFTNMRINGSSLILWNSLANANFTVGANITVSPVTFTYAAPSILEVTE
jgi:hypothetical protein